MVSQDKLIQNGIRYTDSLFEEITNRLKQGVLTSDTLEQFLAKTKEFTSSNPLVTTGYDSTMLNLILFETNNHRFSRPAQKELTRVVIENRVGELITNVGEDIKDSVRDIVKEGYNQSLSQQDIAANIANEIKIIKNTRARSIARTEIARTATISDYVINKERGATHYTVTCRNTCCNKCAKTYHNVDNNDDPDMSSREFLKGTPVLFSINDVENLPPLHVNCRCVANFIRKGPRADYVRSQIKVK